MVKKDCCFQRISSFSIIVQTFSIKFVLFLIDFKWFNWIWIQFIQCCCYDRDSDKKFRSKKLINTWFESNLSQKLNLSRFNRLRSPSCILNSITLFYKTFTPVVLNLSETWKVITLFPDWPQRDQGQIDREGEGGGEVGRTAEGHLKIRIQTKA